MAAAIPLGLGLAGSLVGSLLGKKKAATAAPAAATPQKGPIVTLLGGGPKGQPAINPRRYAPISGGAPSLLSDRLGQ